SMRCASPLRPGSFLNISLIDFIMPDMLLIIQNNWKPMNIEISKEHFTYFKKIGVASFKIGIYYISFYLPYDKIVEFLYFCLKIVLVKTIIFSGIPLTCQKSFYF